MLNKSSILNTKSDRKIALFYLGQEGFLVKYENTYLLIDPYLTDYVDRNCCTDSVQWIRKYPSPIDPSQLDFVDYVLCTHSHFDHADPDTLRAIYSNNTKVRFIAPAPMTNTLISYGISSERIIPAYADTEIMIHQASLLPIPSAHEELHMNADGNYEELGYILKIGTTSLYHAGDCCIYAGLVERLKDVDVLMLPINGRSYFKRYDDDIIGNMTCEEAIVLAKQTDAKLLIPMHYDLYSVNGVRPSHFVDMVNDIHPTQEYHMFQCGECYFI